MAAILLLLLVIGAGATLLLPEAAAAEPFAMTEQGGLRWACGGIGFEERAALAGLRPQANVELLFVTKPRGGYLADVLVTVYSSDSDTPRARVRAQGPICLLHLPAGRYRIEASRHGEHRSAEASGGGPDGRPQRSIFTFPEEP